MGIRRASARSMVSISRRWTRALISWDIVGPMIPEGGRKEFTSIISPSSSRRAFDGPSFGMSLDQPLGQVVKLLAEGRPLGALHEELPVVQGPHRALEVVREEEGLRSQGLDRFLQRDRLPPLPVAVHQGDD